MRLNVFNFKCGWLTPQCDYLFYLFMAFYSMPFYGTANREQSLYNVAYAQYLTLLCSASWLRLLVSQCCRHVFNVTCLEFAIDYIAKNNNKFMETKTKVVNKQKLIMHKPIAVADHWSSFMPLSMADNRKRHALTHTGTHTHTHWQTGVCVTACEMPSSLLFISE